MKILIVTEVFFPDRIGGSGKVVYELARGLTRRGYAVTVLTRSINRLPFAEKIEGINIYRVGVSSESPFLSSLSFFFGLRNIYNSSLKDEVFDLLILNQPFSALCVLGARKLKNIPKLYYFHSSWFQEYEVKHAIEQLTAGSFFRWLAYKPIAGLTRLIEEKVLKSYKITTIMVASLYSKNKLDILYKIKPDRINLIPYGVDMEKFILVTDKSAIRQKLALPQGAFVLFTARNLVPRMGLENLIMAMSQIRQANKGVYLVIAGGGYLFGRLQALANSLGLDDVIRFTGSIEEGPLIEYYQASDLFVLPTRAIEGFGLVTIEALSCGIPVLGTPVGGTVEILGNLEKDLLFDDSSPSSMAKKILEFIGQKKYLAWPADKCRNFVRENYSTDIWISALERLCTEKVSEGIKILHVHTLPVISGSGIHVLESMQFLKNKGYQVEFACADLPGPLIDAVVDSGITFRPLKYLVRQVSIFKDIAALFELTTLIKKEKYHIVHTHNSKAGFIGRLAARFAGTPVVIHTVHGFAFHDYENFTFRIFYVILEMIAACFSDKQIAVSQPLVDWGLSLGIGRERQYCVIPDGIDIEKFASAVTDKERKKEELGIPGDWMVVGLVAKLWDGKGHNTLIEAMPVILSTVPKVKFVFVGEGYLRQELERAVERKGLNNYVIFTGFRQEIPEITSVFDIAVLPSFFEGLGRALLEAMAEGKPVVATNVGGIPYIVRDNLNGLLIKPGKPEELAQAILRLLRDDNLRRKMGQQAKRDINEKFSLTKMVGGIESVYKELLKEKGFPI